MARTKKESTPELPVVNNIGSLPIGQLAEECYTLYGAYVNTHRAIANVADGCKTSYKRIIYMMTKHPKSEGNVPTHNFVPSLSQIHPHGTDGCEGLNAALVRSGVFSGEGFFGSTDIKGIECPHAATRYTKNRLSDLYWDLIGDLIKEVPYEESPQGPMEPTYIPLVLPLCLYMKAGLVKGLGVGICTLYPNFNPWSMYMAYKNNDPTLLTPNVDLILDKNGSELQRLWTTGVGRIIYSYKISKATSPDGKSDGILFETKDGTELFTPNLKKFDKLVEDGKVYIEDLTDTSGSKLFVGRVPGARGITYQDIENIARKICFNSNVYQLNVTDGRSAFRIPLRDWIDYTYKNYLTLVTNVNQKRIERCNFEIAVQKSIPIIGKCIIDDPSLTNEQIFERTKIPMSIIDVVLEKPISFLRKNKDTSARILQLETRLKELKKFNAIKHTEEIIKKL